MKKSLGTRIKELKERNKLNSYALSKLIDVSSASVEFIEDGKTKNPGISFFLKLIDVFKLNPHEFYYLVTGEHYSRKYKVDIVDENRLLKKKCNQLGKEIKYFKEEFSRLNACHMILSNQIANDFKQFYQNKK